MKIISLILLTLFLTACMNEEGAEKHKNRESAAMMDDRMQWEGTVYVGNKREAHKVGAFDSRIACMDAALKHIEEKGYKDAVYSCGGMASDS